MAKYQGLVLICWASLACFILGLASLVSMYFFGDWDDYGGYWGFSAAIFVTLIGFFTFLVSLFATLYKSINSFNRARRERREVERRAAGFSSRDDRAMEEGAERARRRMSLESFIGTTLGRLGYSRADFIPSTTQMYSEDSGGLKWVEVGGSDRAMELSPMV